MNERKKEGSNMQEYYKQQIDLLKNKLQEMWQIFDGLSDGIKIVDINYNVLKINKAFASMSGCDRYKIPGQKCYEICNMSLCKTVSCPLKRILNGEEAIEIELEQVGLNGNKVPLLISANPFYDADGKLIGIIECFKDITERKQIEQGTRSINQQLRSEIKERKRAEKNLKAYIEQSPDGIFVVDKNGKYVDVNPEGAAMLGYEKEELLTMSIPDISSYKGVPDHFEWLKKNREIVTVEKNLIRKDGSFLPVELKAIPIDGDNNYYMAFVRDISIRKKMEQALRKSEEQYRLIFENSPMGLVHYDQTGLITACNDRFSEIIDGSREKIIGINILKDVKNDKLKMAFKQALDGEIGYYEGSYQSLISGKIIPLVAVFKSILSNGELVGVVGICADITERKKAEEALSQSEKYNDLILNGVSEMFALYQVIDESDFKFVKVNNSFLEFVNCTEDEIIGKLIQDVLPEKTAKIWIDNNRNVIKNKKPYKFTDDLPGGTFEVNLVPIFDSNMKCTHFILSARDVTDKKMLQEHETTIEKLNSIGLLAGGIAHDFNNILTVISGNIALSKIKMNNYSEENKKQISAFLNEAEKASHQARHLTQQLLTFAKGGEPITDIISIAELIQETANFVLSGSNVKCDYMIPDDLWPAEADAGLISQVIQNLIINANQAMPNGGKILVSAQNIVINDDTILPLEVGLYIKLSIKDQGIGIPNEYLNKIFDPYFTTKQKGNGLGLSIVHSIISKHKGYITVASEPGKGTTFYLYLPASQQKILGNKAIEDQQITGNGRILLMDDEEMVRNVVSEMLNQVGYEVVCTSNGSEAIEVYIEAKKNGCPFDAVIMDLTIPGGMGGKEATKKLLELDASTKVIVASGYANNKVMSQYKDFGFKAVVSKPFTIEEISKSLNKVIEA